ncbi:MAG: hypothetical protein NC432_01330 [Roseburia sp.]|nr:hypothetical protein [Roseburia sp.]MCM1098132.1 hypothetical protein [Ruminococcus flavefaciens]
MKGSEIVGNHRARKKGMAAFALLAAAVLLLSSCGKRDESNVPDTEYSYIAEYTELAQGRYTGYQDVRYVGQCVYYNQNFFDVVNQVNIPVLKEYSLTAGKVLREMNLSDSTEDGCRRIIENYLVRGDGSLYTEEAVYSGSDKDILLCTYDVEWNLRREQNITAVIDDVRRYSSPAQMALDGEGRICLVVEDILCLFDADGMHLGDVELTDAWIGALGTGRDGKVYVAYLEQGNAAGNGYCLAEIDFEKRELGSVFLNFPEVLPGRTFVAGQEADFLVFDAEGVYEYDLAAQSAEKLLAWVDCGMNGSGVQAVSGREDGGLSVFWKDGNESFLVSLDKVEAALLPEKTEIVIGCLGDSYELQQEAAAFNRQSGSCHVTVRNYAEGDGDAQDFTAALSTALAAGTDSPDILDLGQMEAYCMDLEAIAGNGTFADLGPFLERSGLLKKEDYLENALECYQFDGVLVGIPCYISLNTVVGETSDVGEAPGWTPDEMIAYAAAHPEQMLFDGADRESILRDCLVFGQDIFIDSESGECRFDSEAFKELLAFAAAFPEEYNPLADSRSTQRKIQEGDVLLYKTQIFDFYTIQEHQAMFGSSLTYIGYPAADGSGCIAECGGALAIWAGSGHPEAAWEFIEYHLDRQSDRSRLGGFSTRKSVLDQQMEDATAVSYYLDDDGNPLLDEEGRPVPQDLGGVQWSFEDSPVEYRTATEEEVRCVRDLIESAYPVRAADENVMEIIREEAQPFFLGQKSVEESARFIQNRIQLYMDERARQE